MADDDVPLLTYREAAVRVRRSVRTLWRWRKKGLEMGWGVRDGQRVRLVREDVLLAYWRERMMADPVHLLRIRRKQREGIQG
jgi:hypothetical protein